MADGVSSSSSATDEGLLPHVVGGVAGRVAAESFKSPFDLLKVRLQHDTTLKARAAPVQLLILLRDEKWRAWRGLPPRLFWSAPLAAATFTYYKVLKRETSGGSKFSWQTLLGGPMVLAFSVGLRTPFDIIEQQLQLQAKAQAQAAAAVDTARTSGSTAATSATAAPAFQGAALRQPAITPTPRAIMERIQATWRAEGATGVWRGYQPSLAGITSYVAGYFIFYEGARRWMEQKELFQAHPTLTHLLAGGFGGGLTATLATPFDTIKVRMQTQVYATSEQPNPGVLHVAKATIRDAGWKGLWRGATHRALSNAPSGAIMFAVYEAASRWVIDQQGGPGAGEAGSSNAAPIGNAKAAGASR